MKILLIDVDSKIPNLALMKLSTFYKNKGYEIELKQLNIPYYPKKKKEVIIDANEYEKVFVSIIFTTNNGLVKITNCKEVSFGGTGYSITKKLPEEIEECEEDYSIYKDNNTSYGFITRGCIRNCSFCFVPKKEGMLHKYREIEQIVKHKKVEFLDNNILAYEKCNKELQKLVDLKLRCKFNQGLDIRLIDDEKARLLSQMNYINEYIFAFDNIAYKPIIEEKIKIIKKYIKKDWKVKMYIYVDPTMKIIDTVKRIEWCKKNKVLPYIMRGLECWDDKNCNFYIDIAAYCNQPNMFKKVSFEQFIIKRTNNLQRQKNSCEIYYKNSLQLY